MGGHSYKWYITRILLQVLDSFEWIKKSRVPEDTSLLVFAAIQNGSDLTNTLAEGVHEFTSVGIVGASPCRHGYIAAVILRREWETNIRGQYTSHAVNKLNKNAKHDTT